MDRSQGLEVTNVFKYIRYGIYGILGGAAILFGGLAVNPEFDPLGLQTDICAESPQSGAAPTNCNSEKIDLNDGYFSEGEGSGILSLVAVAGLGYCLKTEKRSARN